MPRRSSRPPSEGAIEAALRLLARRDHSRTEIRLKLQRRGYTEEEVAGAEARLRRGGLLDDAAFARLYTRRRSRSRGPLAISAELAARGIDRETAGAALELVTPEAQLLAAHRLARRLAGDSEFESYRQLLGSIGPKLLRRGFSMEIARRACDGLWDGTEDSPEP